MESRFGYDLSRVRVHTDERAAASAESVGASAYTVGQHVVFGRGQCASAEENGLLVHELLHTIQQRAHAGLGGTSIPIGPLDGAFESEASRAASGSRIGHLRTSEPVLQRQPKGQGGGAAERDDGRLQSLFAEYEAAEGTPVPAWLKEWARKYEAARRTVPDAPPLDLQQLIAARERRRVFGVEPPLPRKTEPLKLAPGAVAANEIFPFPKDSTVLVTHLLAGLLAKYKEKVLSYAAEEAKGAPEGLAANAPLLVDLFTAPDVSRAVRATVLESAPTIFKARIDVPNIPAKNKRPAMKARQIVVTLEARDPNSNFDLFIEWGTGRTFVSGITARRVDHDIVVSWTVRDVPLDVQLSREKGGAVVAEMDNFAIRMALGGQSLKLLRIEPLSAAANTEEAIQQKAKEAQASATFAPSGHELTYGTTLQEWRNPRVAASVGWRFVYGLAGEALALPMQVQLEYAPKGDVATIGVRGGIESTFTAGSVPVTLSLLGGLQAGAGGITGGERQPMLGPSIGARGAIGLSPRVRVFLGVDYFKNLMDTVAERKDLDSVPSVQVGGAVRF